ncbi:NAD(P)-binding protein [Zopfia rhizophila CBS 207.26]|uniref:NAD(P)-binding protein n=1 Tax=Zopfia rhizophila CBS 207.26 TaxID=1314779 RepID=A0A6A6E5M1_9PEZI|nr:NAD(P)-binding protein [Zopfia rhizophila CBS 207.26]
MSFLPDRDIPDLSGKFILVTSGNSGLGKESILQFAKHTPRQIFMGARSRSKAEEAIREIQNAVPKANITFVEIDLSSFASVKNVADSLLQQCDRLDILLNNAGLMGVAPGLTKDGYEMQFGSNHMGPALLTKLLMPLLDKTSSLPGSDVRIVQVSSDAYQFAPKEGILFSQLKTPLADIGGRARYGQSKLANLYFIKSLAKRYPNYAYVSWIINIAKKLFFVDVQTGALGQLWASTGSSNEVKSGAYYIPLKKEVKGTKVVDNIEMADKLWNWTEKEFVKNGM